MLRKRLVLLFLDFTKDAQGQEGREAAQDHATRDGALVLSWSLSSSSGLPGPGQCPWTELWVGQQDCSVTEGLGLKGWGWGVSGDTRGQEGLAPASCHHSSTPTSVRVWPSLQSPCASRDCSPAQRDAPRCLCGPWRYCLTPCLSKDQQRPGF